MKKLLLLPFLFFGAFTVATAQTPASNESAPSMKFDVLEYNFGKIKQGDVVVYEFKFKNMGKEPLIITNATGSCSCAAPDWPKEPIKPGSVSMIKVTFNSAGKMGMQDKTVTITSNAKEGSLVLHMKGNVEVKPVEQVSPPSTRSGSTPCP